MAAVSMLGLTTDCAHVESKSAFLLWETLLNTRKDTRSGISVFKLEESNGFKSRPNEKRIENNTLLGII
jgi:hypothetical protein